MYCESVTAMYPIGELPVPGVMIPNIPLTNCDSTIVFSDLLHLLRRHAYQVVVLLFDPSHHRVA